MLKKALKTTVFSVMTIYSIAVNAGDYFYSANLQGPTFSYSNSYPVKLPDAKSVSSNFTANASNDAFTVRADGIYDISYDIALVSPGYAITAINVNATEIQASVDDNTSNRFQGHVIMKLRRNDIVKLVLNLGPQNSTFRQRTGASLRMVRID